MGLKNKSAKDGPIGNIIKWNKKMVRNRMRRQYEEESITITRNEIKVVQMKRQNLSTKKMRFKSVITVLNKTKQNAPIFMCFGSLAL